MADELIEGAFGTPYIRHDDGTTSEIREGVFGHRWVEHPDKTWTEIRKDVRDVGTLYGLLKSTADSPATT